MKPHFYSVLMLLLFACGGSSNDKQNIKVACAANMLFAMDSIAVVFEQEYDISCDITAGSSGTLTSQIKNGAPYDIFISANMFYPNLLFDEGRGEAPSIYAKGRLIFAYDESLSYSNLEALLKDENFKRIALADMETAPYGVAANQYLENTNLKGQITDRIIVGESIGQVNQYLSTNAVDGGFTSYSFKVKNPAGFNYFEVSQALFEPINQGYTLIKNKEENSSDAAKKLGNFLYSEKGKAILKHFGYLTD